MLTHLNTALSNKVFFSHLCRLLTDSCCNISAENQLEQLSDKRLDKEKLCEKRKGKIIAHKLKPVCKQGQNVKAGIVGIIQKRRNKAHCRAH